MSKRQASRLLQKTVIQAQFLDKKLGEKIETALLKSFFDLQNRLQNVVDGKVKKDREVREMNLISLQMKNINTELKKVLDNEKQKSN